MKESRILIFGLIVFASITFCVFGARLSYIFSECEVLLAENIELNEPTYYHPLDPRAYTCPKCYPGAKGDLCPGHCEPNEPECIAIEHPMLSEGYTFNIWEPNETNVVSLDFIPTWPDYIELEKDLVIIWPKETIAENLDWHYQPKVTMAKGTKIYFKED